MDPKQIFSDARARGFCVFCGGPPETRDHTPPRVFLDTPYPPNLPVVEACESCNNSASLDEQYLACLIECVVCGSTDPGDLGRPRIARLLREVPALAQRLREARSEPSPGETVWAPERARVARVLGKIAQCHVAFDLSEPCLGPPSAVSYVPTPMMNAADRAEFAELPKLEAWPDVGSRAFQAIPTGRAHAFHQWRTVQPGRYAYAVLQDGGLTVKSLFSEYLACTVSWY